MSKDNKVILIIVSIIVLLVVGGSLAGYFWFKKNADRMRGEGKETKIEAEAFGRGKSASVCLKRALDVLDKDLSIMEEVKNTLFLRYCLFASDKPEGFCDDVPDSQGIIATVMWRKKNCAAFGRGEDIRCSRLMRAIQDVCHPYPGEVAETTSGSGSLP